MKHMQEKMPKGPRQAKMPKDSRREAGILFVLWYCAVADMKHIQAKMPKDPSRREAGIFFCVVLLLI